MKTGYLRTPGQHGKSVKPIYDVLAHMSIEDFATLSEQQAREAAANARLVQIEREIAEKRAARARENELILNELDRPEYINAKNAKRKDGSYQKMIHQRVDAEKKQEADMALTDILETLVRAANAKDGPIEKALPGGMHIHLRKDGGSYVLTVWRKNVPPSAREWNTVIAYWPYTLGPVVWSKEGVTESGKHYKQARISVREVI